MDGPGAVPAKPGEMEEAVDDVPRLHPEPCPLHYETPTPANSDELAALEARLKESEQKRADAELGRNALATELEKVFAWRVEMLAFKAENERVIAINKIIETEDAEQLRNPTFTCIYCGEQSLFVAEMKQRIFTCEKHPLSAMAKRAEEAEKRALKAEAKVSELLGAANK